MLTQMSLIKKLLLVSLAAATLTLSACADPDSATTQDDVTPVADPQTQVEQEATGVDDVEQVTDDINSVDTSEDPLIVDPAQAKDDASIVMLDEVNEGEVMDGTGSEEHVSTY